MEKTPDPTATVKPIRFKEFIDPNDKAETVYDVFKVIVKEEEIREFIVEQLEVGYELEVQICIDNYEVEEVFSSYHRSFFTYDDPDTYMGMLERMGYAPSKILVGIVWPDEFEDSEGKFTRLRFMLAYEDAQGTRYAVLSCAYLGMIEGAEAL